jgi:hypothetical protein
MTSLMSTTWVVNGEELETETTVMDADVLNDITHGVHLKTPYGLIDVAVQVTFDPPLESVTTG